MGGAHLKSDEQPCLNGNFLFAGYGKGLKNVQQSAHLTERVGGQKLFGQSPNRRSTFRKVASPGKFLKKDNNQILNNFLPPFARTASAWSLLGVALVALLSTDAGGTPIVAFL